jgi:hypothetical protein
VDVEGAGAFEDWVCAISGTFPIQDACRILSEGAIDDSVKFPIHPMHERGAPKKYHSFSIMLA